MTPEQRERVRQRWEAARDAGEEPAPYWAYLALNGDQPAPGGAGSNFKPDKLHPSSFYIHPRRYWTPWRLGAVAIISSLSVAGFALLVGACMAKY